MRRLSNEELAARAAKYDDLREFRTKEATTYKSICMRGILDMACNHMKRYDTKVSDDELAEVASRYTLMSEFLEKEKKVYDIIIKRGLLDKLCGHMKRVYRSQITKEELAEVAARYTELKEFRIRENPTYRAILRRGLFDELCGHMNTERSRRWVKEELADIASKYDNLAEFREKEYRVYYAIIRRGLQKELFAHMKRGHKDYYTDEELAEIAKRYKTHKEFNENDHSALIAIRTRGLYEQLCGHLEFDCSRRRSEEQFAEIAARYDNLKEFLENEKSVYQAMAKRGLHTKLCSHMKRSGGLALRKIYVFTFSDGYAYVGLTDNIERRYWEHINGKKKPTSITKHIKETGATFEFKVLTDYLDKDTASRMECEYIKQYADSGWKMLNIANGGCLGGGSSQFYSDKYIKKVIAKYEYYEDLRIEEQNLVAYLRRNKLFDKYCSHIKHKKRERMRWTLERAIEAAKECKNKTDFYKRYYQAREILKKAGLLDKYFPKRR